MCQILKLCPFKQVLHIRSLLCGTSFHARICISFPCFVDFIFEHLLFGDIIRNHSLCSALSGKFCKIPESCSLSAIVFFQEIQELLSVPSVSRYFKKGNRLYHHPTIFCWMERAWAQRISLYAYFHKGIVVTLL